MRSSQAQVTLERGGQANAEHPPDAPELAEQDLPSFAWAAFGLLLVCFVVTKEIHLFLLSYFSPD